MSTLPKLPKYSLLEKNDHGSTCHRCGRELKNVYVIKDNETGSVDHYGSGCAERAMGRTLQEVYLDGVAHKNAMAEYDLAQNSSVRVQEFEEVNAEMWAFIVDNSDSDFFADMIKAIEKYGSLTQGQFEAVYRSMLPVAELPEKIKDLELNVIHVKVAYSDFGYYPQANYTLMCETAEGELARVYFSSLSDKNYDYIDSKGIVRIDNDGEYVFMASSKNKKTITVSGSYDGYKIKRAKLS